MKTEIIGTTRKLAVLLGLFAAASAQAGDAAAQGYIMTVFSDLAHGEEILMGASGEAIAKLSRDKRSASKQLEDQINLCVAYAKTNQFDEAIAACDSAIDTSAKMARRIKRSGLYGRESVRMAATGRAIALTNRGVLHAIAGERERARELFETAVELRSNDSAAELNLTYLVNRTTFTKS